MPLSPNWTDVTGKLLPNPNLTSDIDSKKEAVERPRNIKRKKRVKRKESKKIEVKNEIPDDVDTKDEMLLSTTSVMLDKLGIAKDSLKISIPTEDMTLINKEEDKEQLPIIQSNSSDKNVEFSNNEKYNEENDKTCCRPGCTLL